MPVLNPDPRFFAEAIESVLSQTMQDWELIIVEDPSPAEATDILRHYRDPRIRHVRNPTRTSLVSQRNATIARAQGDLLALMDADDIAEPSRLEEQCAYLEAHPETAVLGSQKSIIGPTGEMLGTRRYPCTHEEIATAIRRYNPVAHPSVMLRRQVIEDVGGYRYERQPDVTDYDLWWRLLRRGYRFANHPASLLRYRIHPDQSKNRRLRSQLRATIDVKRMYRDSSFGVVDQLRLIGEMALLYVPPGIVARLFAAMNYRTSNRGG